jgi:hypothetical protein
MSCATLRTTTISITQRSNLILHMNLIVVSPDYRLRNRATAEFDPRQRQRIFPLASVSRPTLRSTQPPIQWVQEVLSQG